MDQIIKCFKNNKNVFCEKPLCFNYDQFKILKKKLPFMVDIWEPTLI